MEKITVALVACLALTINSGCLEEIFVNEEDEIIPQKGLSKNCINYDSKERCWLILIPENINLLYKR